MLNRFCLAILLLAVSISGRSQNISTVAGTPGSFAYSGDGGPATSAKFYGPYGVASDKKGNLYIADAYYHVVRKVTSAGIISTFAGTGVQGSAGDGGPASAAQLDTPYGLAVDSAGNVYIGDVGAYRIRKVTPAGIISTYAGTGTMGFSGDGGPAASAMITMAYRLAIDEFGNLFFPDYMNYRIRKITSSGTITTIAGSGSPGYSGDGGSALAAKTDPPYGIAVDVLGNIYFSNGFSHYIRKVTPAGIISTIAGTGSAGFSGNGGPATSATLNSPDGLKADACGNLFIAETGNFIVRKINSAGIISTVAGSGVQGFSGDGGAATAARMQYANDIALDSAGNMYIADLDNFVIRKVSAITKAAPEVVINSFTNPKCPGGCDGVATATVSGGTSPFNFLWTGGSTVNPTHTLCAGQDTVYVTDANGCKARTIVTLTEPPAINISNISKVQPSCNGSDGSLTITAIGGTPPLSYSIDGGFTYQSSNTFSSLPASTYSVYVRDANGCREGTSTTLSNQGSAVNTATNKKICNGDSIFLQGAWRKTPGTYKDSLSTVNGCDSVVTSTVTLHPLPTAAITGSTEYCFGSATTLTASGGNSYKWSSGQSTAAIMINSTTSGTVNVVVTDINSCKDTAFANYTVNPLPDVNPNSSGSPTCPTDSNGSITVTVSSGTSPFNYQWNTNPAQTTATASGIPAGTYKCVVSDSKGCKDSTTVSLSDPDPINYSCSIDPTTCAGHTGLISITVTSGGSAPFEYSVDGSPYKTSKTFGGLNGGTHTVSVRDSFGCTRDSTFSVGSTNGPSNATASSTPSSCSGGGTIAVRNIVGGTAPYQYRINPGSYQNDSNFTGLPPGSYNVDIRDANGCNYSLSANVVAGAVIDSFAVVPSNETCKGLDGTITIPTVYGGTAPFSYSIDDVNFTSGNSFTNLDSGCYTVVVRDNTGCFSRKTVCLLQDPGIDSVQVTTVSSTCSQLNGSVSVTVFGGKSPYQTSFNSGPFLFQTSYSGLGAGTDSIVVKDQNGCTLKKNFTIADIKGPTSFQISTTQAGCSQNNGSVTITGIIGGTAPYTYVYDTSGATYSTNNVFANLYAGNHKFVARDANGCTLPFTVILSNPPGPKTVSATVTAEDCNANNGSLTITGATGGVLPYQFSFNGSAFGSTTTFNNLDSGTYHVTVRDINNCTFDSIFKIGYNGGPVAMGITITPASCGLPNGFVVVNFANGGKTPYKYSMNGGIPGGTTNFPGINAGIHTVSVTDAGGCRKDSIINVINIPGPSNLSLDHTDDTCSKNTGTIRVLGAIGPARPYFYTIDGNTTPDLDSLFTSVPVGSHTITVTDTNGCKATASIAIAPFSGPDTATLVLTHPHCTHSDGSMQILPASIVGGVAPFRYSVSGFAENPAEQFSSMPQGMYTLVITDQRQCQATQTFTLTDIPGPNFFDSTTVSATCGAANGSMQLINPQGGSSPYRFSIDSVSFNTSGRFTGLAGGSYRVILADQFNCTFARNIIISSTYGPTGIQVAVMPEHCDQNDGMINGLTAIGGTAPFTFTLNNALPQSQGSSYQGLDSGSYVVDVSDFNGCLYQMTYQINFEGWPTAAFSQSTTGGETPQIVDFTNLSTDADLYRWDFGNGATSTQASPSCIYQEAGEFVISLIAEDIYGCSDTAYSDLSLTPYAAVYAPNVFTPDGDGYNETFSIIGYNMVTYRAEIYDRWGQVIFVLDQNHPEWDGKNCKVDVYNYSFVGADVLGNKVFKSGTVNLLR